MLFCIRHDQCCLWSRVPVLTERSHYYFIKHCVYCGMYIAVLVYHLLPYNVCISLDKSLLPTFPPLPSATLLLIFL